MLKKRSPLKHKRGDAFAHAPYASEEKYHKHQGGNLASNTFEPDENILTKTEKEEETLPEDRIETTSNFTPTQQKEIDDLRNRLTKLNNQ